MQYTYDTLFASCQNYCVDNSTTVTVQSYATEFPNLVQLSEMRIIKDLNLAIFDTTTNGSMTMGSQDLVKPTDLIVIQDLFLLVNGNRIVLQERSKSWLDSYWPSYVNLEQPLYYAENTPTLWQIAPTPDQAYGYQVNYTVRPTPMSATNQNTWIGDKLGEVLLYATLLESALYFREDPTTQNGITQLWEQAYQTLTKQAKDELGIMINSSDTLTFPLTTMQQ